MTMKPNLEIAYQKIFANDGPVSFQDIWAEIVATQGYSEEEAIRLIGQFYTNLSLDGRFVTLGENTWDLRSRHTFDKVHIDMNDVYRDVETLVEDVEDEEAAEYIKLLDEEEHHDEYDEDTEANLDDDSDEADF